MLMTYTLDEAAKRINKELGSIHPPFEFTPRMLCECGQVFNGIAVVIRIPFAGKALHSSKGEITITGRNYFEVMPDLLFEFEMSDSVNITRLFDGADVLFIEPPLVATLDNLRIFAKDVTDFIASFKAALADAQYQQAMSQALRDYTATRPASAAKVAAVRLSVATQQNDAILHWIKESQHDPLKFPVPPRGTAGVKKLCRDALCESSKQLFSSASVFNTAWERLRANKEIRDAK